MELLKQTVIPETINKRWLPIICLIPATGCALLKMAISAQWLDWSSILIFNIMMSDFLYTFAGQYLKDLIIWIFKAATGNRSLPVDKQP